MHLEKLVAIRLCPAGADVKDLDKLWDKIEHEIDDIKLNPFDEEWWEEHNEPTVSN